MSIDWTPVIVATIAAAPGLIALFRGARRGRADTADIITQAAERAVKVVQGQLDETCVDLENLNRDHERLKAEHDSLQKSHNKLQRAHDLLNTQHERLADDHEKLSDLFDVVLTGAHVLYDQVIENGVEPPRYKPPERRHKENLHDQR